MVLSDVMAQVRGKKAKKKEAKHKQCFMTGNINSYTRILNSEERLEQITDYNDLAVGISMINAERDKKSMENATKKKEEAAAKKKNKAAKDVEEATKRKDLLVVSSAKQKTKMMVIMS